mmetsp:Transcript_15697/g.16442  ORF Transcript_15697/g.16442 Transcript_15697/m.16442 type:complete len:155 (+) Transcript_15697:25-489(+)|eukprot:CAMPEP_0174820666 /NCGR_PEP_ID=MMETSP1107-20130205/4631_1 /TAXON_ID=36770 /ORGANISM="Paraphysomonas vestita, Strain GFlagA" /LENGTH=154 /DNA_ID=CAMNT_0016036425 /DNA_START=2454 /DNA_END=2918 /DNA_ORIENTATION=+
MAEFFEMPDAEEEVNTSNEQTFESALPAPEPEDALAVFNREWNEKLELKRQLEEKAEEESKASAAQDLSNWQSQREVRLNAKKEVNRTEEQVLLEQHESDLDAGNVWDRVTKLIEASVDAPDDPNKSDVSRMRKLFIQLKNEPLEVTRGALVEA